MSIFIFSSLSLHTVPGPVSDLIAESMLTSIRLTWNPPQEPNGVITAYEVTYRVNSSSLNTVNITSGISAVFTLELAPNSTVSDISVRAYSGMGPGDSVTHPDISTPQIPALRNE